MKLNMINSFIFLTLRNGLPSLVPIKCQMDVFPEMIRRSIACLRILAYGSVEGDRIVNTLIRAQHLLTSEQSPLHLLSISQGTIYCQCHALSSGSVDQQV